MADPASGSSGGTRGSWGKAFFSTRTTFGRGPKEAVGPYPPMTMTMRPAIEKARRPPPTSPTTPRRPRSTITIDYVSIITIV